MLAKTHLANVLPSLNVKIDLRPKLIYSLGQQLMFDREAARRAGNPLLGKASKFQKFKGWNFSLNKSTAA